MVDEKDKKILDSLKKNARLSTQEIAKQTGIPVTTVYNRIRKLESSGAILGYTVVLDSKKIGKPIMAYVLITVDYKQLKEIKMTEAQLAKKIRLSPFVESAGIIAGSKDIILKVRAASVDELDDFINRYLRSLDGIDRTETMIVMHEV